MKAGDIKKFLERAIASDGRRDSLNPHEFNINDNFILGIVNAYKKGKSAEHIKILVDGFITTEMLTVRRRVAVLKMCRDVFAGLADATPDKDGKDELRELLTAYFI